MVVLLAGQFPENRYLLPRYRFSGVHVSLGHYDYDGLRITGGLMFLTYTEGGQLRYAGNAVGYDDIHITGNPADLKVCLIVVCWGMMIS